MGGTMEYTRFRHRNGLLWRPTEHRDPYPLHDMDPALHPLNYYTVIGDLNRFERDVLGVGHEGGDRMARDYAIESGTDVTTVRAVLRAVFETPDYGNVTPIAEIPDA